MLDTARATLGRRAGPDTTPIDSRPRPSHRSRQRRRKDNATAYLFLLPWFLGLVLITIGPMIASAYLSFTDYPLLRAPEWIGLGNYDRMLHDARFWQSMRVTFTYVVISVPLQLMFALALALVLDKGIRGLHSTGPSTTSPRSSGPAWPWPCCGGRYSAPRAWPTGRLELWGWRARSVGCRTPTTPCGP